MNFYLKIIYFIAINTITNSANPCLKSGGGNDIDGSLGLDKSVYDSILFNDNKSVEWDVKRE